MIEAVEIAASQMWDDAMVEVIGSAKREPKQNLVESGSEAP